MNFNELIKGKATADDMIKELKRGRPTDLPDVDEFVKQIDPAQHDINDTANRPDKWVKVDIDDAKDEDGNNITVTVGDGEGKRTTMRKEAVARVAFALQKLIVKRAVAFTFGNPVVLNADIEDGSKEQEVFDAVKKVLFKTKGRTVNRTVAREIFSTTEAAELWYVVDKPNNYGFKSKKTLRCAILKPSEGNELYPYFDETGDLVAFSRAYETEGEKKIKTNHFETYTDELIFKFIKRPGEQWEIEEHYPKDNYIGKIPIIYGRQPEVEWADVQNLIDRLEKLLSNFADTNDYHASPKIVTTGEILGWSKKGEAGAVIEMEETGEAKYLSWDQAPEAVRLEIDTLLRMIYTITQTPDISSEGVKGLGSNISGVALQLLFMDAHLKVQDKMEIFDDYLQRRMAVIQAFLAKMNAGDSAFATACESLDIEPEIEPFMINDEESRINILLAANGQKAIASRKTTIGQLGWVKDTEAEMEQIEMEEAPELYASVMEPTI
ncbi:MAG: phage portal protein [Proteiniphilum sp.]